MHTALVVRRMVRRIFSFNLQCLSMMIPHLDLKHVKPILKTCQAQMFSGIYMVPIVCLCLVQENGHDASAPAAEEPKLQADLQICGQQLQYNCRQNRFTSLCYIL